MNTLLGRISALSSKARVFLAVFVVLGTGFGAWLMTRGDASTPPDDPTATRAAARVAQIAALTRDQDADGLKDWEEGIFRTDPQNPDTDTDGTSDGEEIRQSRDPLVHGPNDALATSTQQVIDWEDTAGPVNLTGRIAQSLGQQLIAQHLLNPEKNLNPKEIAAQIAEGAAAYKPAIQSLTLKDLTITKDESPETIIVWAEQFDAAIQRSFRNTKQDEVSLMLQAIQKEDYQALTLLDAYITAYDAVAGDIKKLPVPSSFSGEQLRFLNLLVQFREIATHFRTAEEDPVAAIAGIKPYFMLTDHIEVLNKEVRRKLAERHITF